MQSHKKRALPSRGAIAVALSLAFGTPALHAAGLGRLTVQSALGQPLRAEVEVTSVSRDEANSLAVRLASQAQFRQANLEFNPALAVLRFALEKRSETSFVIKVNSLQPINEPFLDVLLELSWNTGRVLREYTVLLDPPALKATPEVLPPLTAQPSQPARPTQPAQAAAPTLPPAPSPVVPPVVTPSEPAATAAAPAAPEPAAAPAPAQAPAPAVAEQPASTADGYTVKAGDTLGKIAARNKPANVSLDQMLVALFQANPNAFAGSNMNRLIAGRTLAIPSAEAAAVLTPAEARREVIAQSSDFAQYRSRLAQAVSGASTADTPSTSPAAQGNITTRVEDKAAPAKPGDQLQIAKTDAANSNSSAALAARKADEEIAKQRALREQEERAAELKKTNEAIQKALELKSKTGSQVQQQADTKSSAASEKAAPAPAAAPSPVPQAAAPAPAPAPEPQAVKPVPAPVETPAPAAEAARPEVAPTPPATAPTPAPEPAAPKKATPTTPAAAEPSFIDQLLSPYVLGGLGVVLLALLGFLALNNYRRRKIEKSDEFKSTGDGLRANSLFGATGGQSVDTGATSTFNSSFIPAASQLDSNEVDPVAEADVYIAYGREEQAEDILKEALRLQPDRHAVRVKLLEIYSRRGDKASFVAVAQELRDRTGGSGEDWERAAKLGRALDPSNPMFAGAGADTSARGPTTELRLNPNTASSRGPATLGGAIASPSGFASSALGAATTPTRAEPAIDLGFGSSISAPQTRSGPDTRLTPDTAMPVDSRFSANSHMPADSQMTMGATTQAGPTTRFEATLPEDSTLQAGTQDDLANPFATPTNSAVDFSSLDFDLGPGAKAGAATPAPAAPSLPSLASAPATAVSFDLNFDQIPAPTAGTAPAPVELSFPAAKPASPPTMAGLGSMPDVDLNLPVRSPAPVPAAASSYPPAPTAAPALQSALEESLSRPTLLSDVSALPDDQAQRLTSNTDQATVPLIDFDLTGADVELGGRRTETQAGSPLAGQMATKLDLARGYIDLGVKDGARELLEEVMRDGTREQRQQAVELMKQVEA